MMTAKQRLLRSSTSGGTPGHVELVGAPTISGTPTTEQTLTAALAEWSRTPNSRTRQWWSAEALMVGDEPLTDDDDNILYINETPISGATAATYLIAIAYGDFPVSSRDGDVQKNYVIFVEETARFAGFSLVARSEAVGVIYYTDRMAGVGSFPDSTGWTTLSNGFSIAGGQLLGVANASAGVANHATNTAAGYYRFVFDLKARTAGSCQARFTGGVQGLLLGTAQSTVVDNIIQNFADKNTNATVGFSKTATFDGAIDNLRLFRYA